MPDRLADLRAVWPEAGSLDEKLAVVNAMTEVGPVGDIPLASLRERLAEHMAHLECFALAARTRSIRHRLHMSPVPGAVTSAVYLLKLLATDEQVLHKHRLGVLKQLLGDLVGDETSGITRMDADYIIALSRPAVPWRQLHGYSQPLGVYDAIEAGVS
jgi:hypothetical protein